MMTQKNQKSGRQCCAGQDILDAKRVSEKLGIKHEILYYQKNLNQKLLDLLSIATHQEKPLYLAYNVIKQSNLGICFSMQKL